MSAANPYQSFAKIFSSYHEQYGGPSSIRLDTPLRYDVVLDEEGGLLASLMGSIEETIRTDIPDEEREVLLKEHRTWQLMRALYDNRLHRLAPTFEAPSAERQLQEDPYVPPEDLAQTIINESSELSLYATLLDHLHSRPLLNTAPPLESRHGYLPSTIHKVKGQGQKTSIDPDFTLRDPHGASLAGEDQTYQTPLLETLYDLVRHGELDHAVNVCEEGGEPWRAATLMGGRRWTSNPHEGNRTRALWKKSCRAMAKNPTLHPAERYLYAALISDLPTLLPACESWEDHLWAHVLARTEAQLESRFLQLGGFWQHEDSLLGTDESETDFATLNDIFASIAQSGTTQARISNTDPYYVAQRMIIQGQTELLFEQFISHLPSLYESLNQPVPDAAANTILQAYLQILESDGNDGLVAMYAACLREGNGEESYARFLSSMDPTATLQTKVEALNKARQHNLDVAVIVRETVRMILQSTFATLPALSGDQPDITGFSSGLDEKDVELIRSIEWLVMVPETAADALIQSNAVARYFLALGQAGAAQALLKTLPPSLVAEDDHIDEHDSFAALFAVFRNYEIVEDILANAPKSTAPKMEQHNWRKSVVGAIERTEVSTLELLTSQWLRFDLEAPSSSRSAELARIRQVFIPDLVMRLHNLLISNRHIHPPFLQHALDLTKIVADEDYHVYEEFFGKGDNPYRLVAYLERIRECSIEALSR